MPGCHAVLAKGLLAEPGTVWKITQGSLLEERALADQKPAHVL